jgi:hypothetical protein
VPAGLFHSWQSCLQGKQTEQQQQQLSRQFMSQVATVWSKLLSIWHANTPGRVSKVAPVLLRSLVPALQFADLCMQQAALAPGASANSSSSSSSGGSDSISKDDYSVALPNT